MSFELQADLLAGLILATQGLRPEEKALLLEAAEWAGDRLEDARHHGTPEMRRQALLDGMALGEKGHDMRSAEFGLRPVGSAAVSGE